MAEDFDYDVFISYSHADKRWVRGTLLPYLEKANVKVFIDFRDSRIGAPFVKEMERAVVKSRKTLLILTPAYLSSTWATFENVLLQTLDPPNQELRLIPVLKKPCDDLPLRLRAFHYIDFTAGKDLAWERLLDAIGAPVRPPRVRYDCLSWPPLLAANLAITAALALLLHWSGLIFTLFCVPEPAGAFGVALVCVLTGQVLWRHAGSALPLRALAAIHLCRLSTPQLWAVAVSLSTVVAWLLSPLSPLWNPVIAPGVVDFSVMPDEGAEKRLSPGGMVDVRAGHSVTVSAQVHGASGACCKWSAERGYTAEEPGCSTVYTAPLGPGLDNLTLETKYRCRAGETFAGLVIHVKE